jgi:broad specificity phosphatase PhoE
MQWSNMAHTELLLVRHGATCANEQVPPVLQGYGVDHSLSPKGRLQADRVAALLADFAIDAVYASEMARAIETAAAIASPHDLPVAVESGLHEIDVGRWEGMTWEEIAVSHPDELRAFRRPDSDLAYFGGESFGDVWGRVSGVLHRLQERHAGQRIVLVAHKGVNRAILAHFLGLAFAKAKTIAQENCCVNQLQLAPGGGQIAVMNSMFHLR